MAINHCTHDTQAREGKRPILILDEEWVPFHELAAARADVVAAAGALLVDLPEPGTDMARVMLVNAQMRRERDEARAERDVWREKQRHAIQCERDQRARAERAEAEAARLLFAVQNAPHEKLCATMKRMPDGSLQWHNECSCWKRAALAQEGGQ